MPLVGVGFIELVGAALVEVGSGGIPKFCSVQYEFPLTSSQEVPTEGFYGQIRPYTSLSRIHAYIGLKLSQSYGIIISKCQTLIARRNNNPIRTVLNSV